MDANAQRNLGEHRSARAALPSADLPLSDFEALVATCPWPSEAYWRAYELAAVRRVALPAPVLEIGCGDGAFSDLAGLKVDLAVDANPRAVPRAAARTDVYAAVECGDVRTTDLGNDRFATVFANSVLEHVPELEDVLAKAYDSLRAGGVLVTTVPLDLMNDHLLVRGSWYARLRQRQLVHRNLWSREEWERALRRVGFDQIDWAPTLPPAGCRRWDGLDMLGSLGVGRLRVGGILRKAGHKLLPARLRRFGRRQCARALHRLYGREQPPGFCAALLTARKGYGRG
jgi:SAM-dependent methyltransferase